MGKRIYQDKAVEEIWKRVTSGVSVLAIGPGACGKTLVAGRVIARFCETNPGKRVVWIVGSYELGEQALKELRAIGLDVGIWFPLRKTEQTGATVLITSPGGGFRRVDKNNIGLLVIDEGHHAAAKTYRQWGVACPGVPKLGLTATPRRRDKLALSMFDEWYTIATALELVKDRYIMDPEVYVPTGKKREMVLVRKLERMKPGAGIDFPERELARVMTKPKLAADMLAAMDKWAPGMQRLIFSINEAHGRWLERRCNDARRPTVYLSGRMKKKERADTIARFKAGKIENLISTNLLIQGFNYPALQCVVCMRPTKSERVYKQMCARGTRVCKGKTRFIFLDHGSNCSRMGLPHSPDKPLPPGDLEPVDAPAPRKKPLAPKTCVNKQCSREIPGDTRVCPWPDCESEQPQTELEITEAKAEMQRALAAGAELRRIEREARKIAKERGMSIKETDAWVVRILEGQRGAA